MGSLVTETLGKQGHDVRCSELEGLVIAWLGTISKILHSTELVPKPANVLPQRPSTMTGYKNQKTKLPPANFCCLLLFSVALCITGLCPFLFPFIDNKPGFFNKLAAMPVLIDWPLPLEKLYTNTCYTEPQNSPTFVGEC